MRADGALQLTIPLRLMARRAGAVGIASLLLASCSTSTDPFSQLGLAQQTSPQYAPTQTADAAQTADDGNYTFVEEGDPDLPQDVASTPALSDGSDTAAYAGAEAGQQPTVGVFPEAPAQVDDPVLAARMGGAAQTAPAEPRKRNFFASLFSAPRDNRPKAPTGVQRPRQAQQQVQPQQADIASAAPQPEAAGSEPADEVQVASAASTDAAAPVQTPEPTAFFENRPPEAVAQPQRKRGFLSSLFSGPEQQPKRQPSRPRQQVEVASAAPAASASASNFYGSDALPGVRSQDSLYEIRRKSGTDDDSDIDINEGDSGVEVAMAPGMARLAPNGLVMQTDRVDIACLKPSLVRVLKAVEGHYGERVVVTSGYRSPPRNARARGARNSLHMYCAAADIQVEGVTKWELASFLREMPGRGGVGTYCHTKSVHIDVGPERDWNWRCRRRKRK